MSAHVDLLLRLEPKGYRDVDAGTMNRGELEVIGAGLDAADAQRLQLLGESRPQDAAELVSRWEELYRLRAGGRSTGERRARVLGRLRLTPDLTPATIASIVATFLNIDVADVEIVEPFALYTDDPESLVDDPETLVDGANQFMVRIPWAVADASSVSRRVIEALLADCKPAHATATVQFAGFYTNSPLSLVDLDLLAA